MNYFAHGYRFIDDPYFVAGTAVPDWLNVVDRRTRVRPAGVERVMDDSDQRVAAIARGVQQHLHDDRWFHATRAFNELSWQLTGLVRTALPGDDSMRVSFLGHILVELLLDAHLIAEMPQQLERYYQAIGGVEGAVVEQAIERMSGHTLAELDRWIGLFVSERFLCDYGDDERLLYRLNQVMRRVRLDELPASLAHVLAEARREVGLRRDELLAPDE